MSRIYVILLQKNKIELPTIDKKMGLSSPLSPPFFILRFLNSILVDGLLVNGVSLKGFMCCLNDPFVLCSHRNSRLDIECTGGKGLVADQEPYNALLINDNGGVPCHVYPL